MSPWQFRITRDAEQNIEQIDSVIRNRIEERLEWLVEHFEELVPLPLGGSLRNFFKLRVGDWRIVYEIDNTEHIVTVHAVGRRDKIYKRK